MPLQNMKAIETVTVGAGGASSISFSSIPSTFTDLVVYVSARNTSSFNAESAVLSLNGSTSSFSGIYLQGSGSAAASGSFARFAFNMPAGTSTSSTFSNSYVYFPNYTSSNNKSYTFDSVTENNGTEAYATMFAGLWSNTAAITSITFTPSSGNFAQYSTATLYGVTSSAYGAKATGGIISQDANYFYHTFLASGTFTPTQSITADYLVVAGGGGGGGCTSNGTHSAGGGGAGGLRSTVTATGGGGTIESALSLTASTAYTVTVGAGGAGSSDATGSNGNNSVFGSITSTAGGGGGGRTTGTGQNGGSGGGASATGGGTTGGTGTANQGYAGGNVSGSDPAGAGGGGAGGAGSSVTSPNGPGTGGNGVATSISGSSVTYAGGGGGGGNSNVTTGASGGTGGGGAGGNRTGTGTGTSGIAGTTNTGSGGGGSPSLSSATPGVTGGNGGSGIVIVRYAK
jgi:hypothetical protein